MEHQRNLCSLLCSGTVCQNASIFPVYARFYKGAAKRQHTLGTVCKSNEISCQFWRECNAGKIFTLYYKGLKKKWSHCQAIKWYGPLLSNSYKSLWAWLCLILEDSDVMWQARGRALRTEDFTQRFIGCTIGSTNIESEWLSKLT